MQPPVKVELSKCRGTDHPYCTTCERYDPKADSIRGSNYFSIEPMMTKPGLCFNHVLIGRTSEIQIKSEKERKMRLRGVCQRCQQNIHG